MMRGVKFTKNIHDTGDICIPYLAPLSFVSGKGTSMMSQNRHSLKKIKHRVSKYIQVVRCEFRAKISNHLNIILYCT